jgi:hypothetical protein
LRVTNGLPIELSLERLLCGAMTSAPDFHVAKRQRGRQFAVKVLLAR